MTALVLLLAQGIARAAEPTLLPPSQGWRAPADPLHIETGPQTAARQFAVELDDIDLTELMTVSGGRLTVTPLQALVPGQHTLRLVEFTDDGEIIERGFWTFEVRDSRAFGETDGAMTAALTLSHRLAADALAGPPPPTGMEGIAQLQGRLADGPWRLDAGGELLYNPRTALRPEGNAPLDLGDFALTGEAGPWRALLGHPAPLPESLVASDFQRRGATLAYRHPAGLAQTEAFLLRTQEITGLGADGLGLDDGDNRIGGLSLALRPWRARRDDMALSLTWLSGADPGAGGYGIGSEPLPVATGDALSLAADSLWLDQRLRLRGELARTRYDFDGPGGYKAETDDAFALLATYVPAQPLTLAGEALGWQVQAERRRVGSYFRSLADPDGVTDRDALRGRLSATWRGFDLQFGLGREHDNLAALALLPRVETRRLDLALSWSAAEAPAPWLGLPALFISYDSADQRIIRAGGDFTPGALGTASNLTLGADFSYDYGAWGITLGRGDETGASAGEGSENRSAEWRLNLMPLDTLSLDMTLQRERWRSRAGGASVTTSTADLNLDYRLGMALSLSLNGSGQRQDSADGDSRSHSLGGALRWQASEGSARRPAVALALEGQLDRQYDPYSAAWLDQYQLFLRLDTTWQGE